MGFCQGRTCKRLIARMLACYYEMPVDRFLPGSLRLPDGQTVSGGLDVRYYQTASPWLAKALAQELARRDWHSNQKRYQPLDLPQLTAQQAYGYAALFPTVVLQKGDRVLRATFYQTGAQIPYAQWVQALDAGL
jgi:hypothetical protein